MPARRDLDPAEMRGLLPILLLIDVEGEVMRYRLAGTAVVTAAGIDPTGHAVGGPLERSYGGALRGMYEAVCRDRTPVFVTTEFLSPTRVAHASSRLVLPLSDDGTE